MTIKIKLMNAEGSIVEHKQKRVSARKFREALAFAVKEEKGEFADDLAMMDELVELVAGLFESEDVNLDSIYDGLEASDFAETLREVLMSVLGGIDNSPTHPAVKGK